MTDSDQARAQLRAYTRFELAALGLRLGLSLARRFNLGAALQPGPAVVSAQPDLAAALAFVAEQAAAQGIYEATAAAWLGEIRQTREASSHPISRVLRACDHPEQGHLLADLLLLAGLADQHEGYATLFRLLHPQGLPYPSLTLALHWLEDEIKGTGNEGNFALRDALEDLLLYSPQARLGIVRLEGDGPWHSRLLRPGPGAWEALFARPLQQTQMHWLYGYTQVPGLDHWLQQRDVQKAMTALHYREPCLIALVGGSDSMRQTRARALLGAAGAAAIRQTLNPLTPAHQRQQQAIDTYSAAWMQQACAWLHIEETEGDLTAPRLVLDDFHWRLPLVISAPAERDLPELGLAIICLRVEPLSAVARREMWQALLPSLGPQANLLAARYSIDPAEASQITQDLALRQRIDGHPLALDDIGDCLRARSHWRSRPGVQRLVPKALWRNLFLPATALQQLQQAVLRIHQQITVLDDWGFEQGRQDRRGLRMLFYGPPGTGKTLAAEAMAQALGVDLLVVDISSLVSKWIGETEKNLAGVFDLAESSRALLLFDEADALFGKRSDVNDASDRYANLETAYLLQRLERYEGVAVLTTNLRTSLDAAFTRRFEYIVEFPEPDATTRASLWRQHLPPDAPLHPDLDLAQLADWYAISGAQIRNAALGAAFLAAAEGSAIAQRHFLLAIEREYDKAGKAHPGFPAAPTAPEANHQQPHSLEH